MHVKLNLTTTTSFGPRKGAKVERQPLWCQYDTCFYKGCNIFIFNFSFCCAVRIKSHNLHNEEEWTLFCLLERAIFAIVVELSDFEAIVSILQVMDVQRSLEHDLELLCLTGVEDKLQVITCRVHRKLN